MKNKFLTEADKLKKIIAKIPKSIGQVAINHALENFKAEAFEDQKWKPRKDGSSDLDRTSRRALLVKSGALRGSIRILLISSSKVVIGSTLPYAAIQNNGGETHPRITEKSRKYFWAAYNKTGNPKYKAMALTKKSSFTVKIPSRPFLKDSPQLKKKIEKTIMDLFN